MVTRNYSVIQAKIHKEIEKLRKKAEVLQSKRRIPILRSIIQSMREYSISIDEITAAVGKKPPSSAKIPTVLAGSKTLKAKRPVPAKYRDPNSGATWTGRGRTPVWVIEAEKGGKARDSFLI